MTADMKQLMNTIEINEIRLWELFSVEEGLRRQIQELSYNLEHTDSTEIEFQSKDESMIFNSIDDAIIEYEAKLWQLLENKSILETYLRLIRTSWKCAVKMENANDADELSSIKPPDCFESPQEDDILFDSKQSTGSSADSDHDNCFIESEELLQTANNRRNTGSGHFKCPTCCRIYRSQANLHRHMLVHSQEPIPCKLCSKTFPSVPHLKGHMAAHKENSPHVCKICCAKFVHRKQLNYHIKRHRDAGVAYPSDIYSCAECNEEFDGRQMLFEHLKVHTGGKPFECYLCHRRYHNRPSLRDHFRNHLVDKSFACSFCDKKYVLSRLLRGHVKYKHSENRPFLCTECGKAFSTGSSLRSHSLVHTGGRPPIFECQICSKKYTQKNGLVEHMRGHTNDKYKCNLCENEYASLSGLQRHKKDKHDRTKKKTFVCIVCNHKLGTAYSLSMHIKTHQEKKVKCPDCDRHFLSEYAKTTHMRRIHLGERKAKCEECNERFFDTVALKVHQLKHNGIKRFECAKCEKKFLTSAGLINHQPVHSDVRKYKCKQCISSFKTSRNLDRHMMIHTNAKPYSCEVCNAQFADSSYIKIHMRIHTGEKPFACSVCDRRFMDQRNMKKHMKIHTK